MAATSLSTLRAWRVFVRGSLTPSAPPLGTGGDNMQLWSCSLAFRSPMDWGISDLTPRGPSPPHLHVQVQVSKGRCRHQVSLNVCPAFWLIVSSGHVWYH